MGHSEPWAKSQLGGHHKREETLQYCNKVDQICETNSPSSPITGRKVNDHQYSAYNRPLKKVGEYEYDSTKGFTHDSTDGLYQALVSWQMPAEVPAYWDVGSTVDQESEVVTGNVSVYQCPPTIQQPTKPTVSEEMVKKMNKLDNELKRVTSENISLQKQKLELEQQVEELNLKNSEQSSSDALEFSGKATAEIGILKGQVKALNAEIDRLNEEIEDLLKEKAELKQERKRLEQSLSEEQRRVQQLDTDLKENKTRLSEKQKRIQEQDTKLKENKRKSENESRRKDETIQDLTKRLSDEMGTKVASDESSLENVNIKDRPMNIASEYELLCSDQWLMAKTDLDELMPSAGEETKMTFLCGILITSLAESEKLKKSMVGDVGRILNKPGVPTQHDSSSSSTETVTLPDKLMQNMLDLKRQTVETTDLSVLHASIQKAVTTKANSTFDKPEVMTSNGVGTYIKACAVTTWKMILQRPPMIFRQDGIGGKWEGEKMQEVFWSSSDPDDPLSRVKYYVHPALYHGEAMMVKGRVFLGTEQTK